jgi:hypothetical protein
MRNITHASSGSACSTGLTKGKSACSAAGLPRRAPVARPSQKLPPTKVSFSSSKNLTGLWVAYAADGG